MKVRNRKQGEVTLEITLSAGQWSMLADRMAALRASEIARPQPVWLVEELPERIREAL
jgi:hypothetical protein